MSTQFELQTNSIKSQINDLLDDSSFPSLVVLDGAWGSGKTYFVKNHLIDAYKSKPIYLSIVGLANRDDFINRVIATNIGIDGEHSGSLKSLVDSIQKAVTKTGSNSAGALMTVVGGLTGVIKDTAIKGIKNKTFIIDDIERLERKDLKEQIIGECYLLAESNDIKFIFLTDREQLKLDDPVVEKYFSGVVDFSMTMSNILSIVFNGKEFANHQEQIETALSILELKNLRVLKRVAWRIAKIHKEIEKLNYDVDIALTMRSVINDSITIAFLANTHSKTAEEIESFVGKAGFPDDQESDEDERIIKQLSYMFNPTSTIIRFIRGDIHKFDDVHELIAIIAKDSPIDQFMHSVFVNMTDESFRAEFPAFKRFILESTSAPFMQWFEACEVYLLLIAWNYIDGNKKTFFKEVEQRSKIISFDVEKTRSGRSRCLSTEIDTIMIETRELLKISAKQNWINEFTNYLPKNWLDAERSLGPKTHKARLHLIKGGIWINAIDKWDTKSINEFGVFISKRLGISNAANYYKAELGIITFIQNHVKGKIKQENAEFSLKRGHLFRLSVALDKAIINLKIK
jgi:hypothetical protein